MYFADCTHLKLFLGPGFLLSLACKLLDVELVDASYVGLLVLGCTHAGLTAAGGGDNVDALRCATIATVFYDAPSGCCKVGGSEQRKGAVGWPHWAAGCQAIFHDDATLLVSATCGVFTEFDRMPVMRLRDHCVFFA